MGEGRSEDGREPSGLSSSAPGLFFLVDSCTLFDGIISIYDMLRGLGATILILLVGAGKMEAWFV